MGSVLSKFDNGVNYWNTVPQMKVIEPFKSFYKNDKSKNKSKSSRTMWAIAMLLEVEDNRLAMYSEDERKNVIAIDFLEEEKFDWKSITKLTNEYEKSVLTPAKRALLVQRRKTDERSTFLSSVKYTLINAKELDNLLANTDKFLSILKNLENQVKLESSLGNKKGGREESLSERGVI